MHTLPELYCATAATPVASVNSLLNLIEHLTKQFPISYSHTEDFVMRNKTRV